MAWNSTAVSTTNLDAGTDSAAAARADLLDLAQKHNQNAAHVTTFMQGLLDDSDAATARTTLDVPSRSGANASGTWGINISGNATTATTTTTLSDGANITTGNIAAARIANALNASGSAPIYACRAWVNFNGTGTVAIRASGNVSSITDNGVGDYTVNFTTAMPDDGYAWNFSCNGNSSGMQQGAQLSGTATAPTLLSTTQIRLNTGATSGGANIDMSHVSVTIFR